MFNTKSKNVPYNSPTSSHIFYGTRSEWDKLSESEKSVYELGCFTDEEVGNNSNTITLETTGSISTVPYDDCCITGISVVSATEEISDKLHSLQEDNLSSMEDIKAKLAEQDARIQQLESEIEILKSQNPDKFSENKIQNTNLADFF